MKTLIIVRHAKSSWDMSNVEDRERPLNDRGKKDAPAIAKRLKGRGIQLDLLVSSPAKRAKKTAKYFAEAFDFSKKDIVLNDALYEAGVPAFYEVVENLNDKFDTAAIFSHNPGITEFVNTLTDRQIDDMPTCAVFAISINEDSWKNFKSGNRNFLFFDYPKSV